MGNRLAGHSGPRVTAVGRSLVGGARGLEPLTPACKENGPHRTTCLVRATIRTLTCNDADGLTPLRVGPLEAEWNKAGHIIPSELRGAPQRDRTNDSTLREIAVVSPRTAILGDMTNSRRIWSKRHTSVGACEGMTTAEVVDAAHEARLIDATTRQALVGVGVLRNLTAHSPRAEPNAASRVDEFLALADAAEYALDHQIGALGPDSITRRRVSRLKTALGGLAGNGLVTFIRRRPR